MQTNDRRAQISWASFVCECSTCQHEGPLHKLSPASVSPCESPASLAVLALIFYFWPPPLVTPFPSATRRCRRCCEKPGRENWRCRPGCLRGARILLTARPVPIHAGADQPQTHDESLDMPRLGATFVPGGYDDYYMPEVVAPSPQRCVASPVPGELPTFRLPFFFSLSPTRAGCYPPLAKTLSVGSAPPPPESARATLRG